MKLALNSKAVIAGAVVLGFATLVLAWLLANTFANDAAAFLVCCGLTFRDEPERKDRDPN